MLINDNGVDTYYYYLFNLQGDIVGIMDTRRIYKLINGFISTKDTRDNRIDLGLGIMSFLSRGKGCINVKYLFIQRQ